MAEMRRQGRQTPSVAAEVAAGHAVRMVAAVAGTRAAAGAAETRTVAVDESVGTRTRAQTGRGGAGRKTLSDSAPSAASTTPIQTERLQALAGATRTLRPGDAASRRGGRLGAHSVIACLPCLRKARYLRGTAMTTVEAGPAQAPTDRCSVSQLSRRSGFVGASPQGTLLASHACPCAVATGVTDGNAEVLRIHVDDPETDFRGADKHYIQDDDFENEDSKFAANILHKQAAAEEEEEVYEGLEAGDEDMAWVPPSVHRVRCPPSCARAAGTVLTAQRRLRPCQAQVHRTKRLFERGVAPIWNTQLSELGVMGAGIPLYFRLLVRSARRWRDKTALTRPPRPRA